MDAGTYTVIATASAKKFESADSNEAAFTIRQKTLTNEMVTAKDTEYTGNTVAVVVKDGDKTLVEGKDYTVIYSGSNPNAGEASAAITGIGNYKGTVNTTYTILPKEVENDSVIAAAKEKYYTGKAVTLSEEDVTVTYNGKVLTAGTDYIVGNYKDNVEEGTALATVTFTCVNDASHVETLAATITSKVKTPATCTEKGITEYSASVSFNGNTYTDIKEVADIPATSHHYIEGKCSVCGAIETTATVPNTDNSQEGMDNVDANNKALPEISDSTLPLAVVALILGIGAITGIVIALRNMRQ